MGKRFRWLFGVVAVAVISAVAQAATNLWLFDTNVMNWIEQIIGVDAFPWFAAGSIGLAVGVWLDPVLQRLDGRYPLFKKDRAKAIGVEAAWAAADISRALRNPFGPDNLQDLWVPGLLVMEKIERLGLPVPPKRNIEDRDELSRMAHYLRLMARPLSEGNLRFAKDLALILATQPNDEPVKRKARR